MLLYGSTLPETPTFAPSVAGLDAADQAATRLWDATRELQLYRDNTNAEDTALGEAYERRNRAIFEATGVQLKNPRRDFGTAELQEGARLLDSGGDAFAPISRAEQEWTAEVQRLARERPEFASVINAGRPITEDAFAIARGAEQSFEQAAGDPSLGGARRVGNLLGGGIAGMLRDPLQVATLFVGGGISGPARTVAGKILQTMFSEAIVNGGVEAGVQAASQDWRRSAGVENGLQPALQQVGLAALFGGGFGGLLQGGAEVFRLLGKAPPQEALARAAAGNPQAGDMEAIASALEIELAPEMARIADLAAEQSALDRAAFGPPPAGLDEAAAEALAATTLRQAENPPDLRPDLQERAEAVDRIVADGFQVGRRPRRPQSLLEFLSANGGLKDDAGELASLDAGKWRKSGYRKLLQENGRSLDMAREAAEEAGYLGRGGEVQTTSVADLLDAIGEELGGQPRFSREDGQAFVDIEAYETALRGREAYRRIVEQVDAAVDTLGVEGRIDDALLIRAAELVDDETDPVAALERALEEDYRSYADALDESGEGFSGEPEFDAPFFDLPADAGARSRPGGNAGTARANGPAGGRRADEADGDQFPRAGDDQGSQGFEPLRPLNATPEPASTEALEVAELALVEARGSTSSPRGETADEAGGEVTDMWDAMPAARNADGTVAHVTHSELIEDAERDGFLGDLIASCKD
jgi:hypothetical protein